MSIDRAVEAFTVVGIIGVVMDKIRLLQDEAVKELDSEWVAENGPHLPLESLKEGMLSVHEEYQSLQVAWKDLMFKLRSRKADTEAVEQAMIALGVVSLRLAMDIRARAVRTGTYVIDDRKECQPVEEPLALAGAIDD
jgi:hypothetical protein